MATTALTSLAQQYRDVRAYTVRLCDPLETEDRRERSLLGRLARRRDV